MKYSNLDELYEKKAEKEISFYDMYTLSRYRKFIKDSDRLLDIGCRNGEFSRFIKDRKNYHGIELSSTSVERAKKKGLNVMKGNIEEDVPFSEGSFDVILMSHVLEHLKSPYDTIEKCSRLLKKNGRLIIIVPNSIALTRLLFAGITRRKNYPFTKTEVTHYGHFQTFNVEELHNIFRLTNFRPIYHTITPYSRIPRWMKAVLNVLMHPFGENLVVVARKSK